ncbi:hypothetical protein [Reinekea marinisedimentorum]|jgi:hypothetical protein|uniref:Uncharacterized protein n=1 Tax=Reinekea marinisedimentorum TaxID=230495 RepID=A0A4V2UKB8_9GAMM|nr:hypothetical protein [Reinekea marinisedimentorum]TCS43743.1 hypothetical protein BCF53_10186 [Reinekea marinisedimentorum]
MIKKRSKPDIIVLLVLILGLGVTLSGMTQSESRQPLSKAEMQASGIILNQTR